MKKPVIILVSLICLISLVSVIVLKNKKAAPAPVEEEKVELPVNTIPVEERPYITLTPDLTGRNVTFAISKGPTTGLIEYEMVYNASDKQEGVFGRIDLATEKQPVAKEILLGSKSGGGKVTYHEGITGGSLSVTYGDTKLKEQFNFLRFDPTDPTVSSSDVRFSATLPKTSFKKDNVIIVMKSFGLPAPVIGKLVSGPYALLGPSAIKGSIELEMKLPAGDYANAAIYAYVDGKWVAQKTTVKDGDTLTATVTAGNVFAISEEK